MDSRLRRAIATEKIAQHAEELARLALRALEDLKQLDESLYERFVESRRTPQNPAVAAERIRVLATDTFKGMLELLDYCRALLGEQPVHVEEVGELDFGDLEGTPPPTDVELDLGEGDIGDLLDNLDHTKRSDTEHWSLVLEKISSIEYGLRSQHDELKNRLEIAIGSGELGQILGVLDDATSSATEGVQAVVAALYAAFLPDVDPTTIVPKYLTSLGRALLVRRALAELSQPLGHYNAILQDETRAAEHPEMLAKIRELVLSFVKSPVCHAMRPADRMQMEELELDLRNQPPKLARLTSEGLVKYIESLGSINQREVLVQHDRRTLDEMREALATARQLFDLSPRVAGDMLDRAYHAAQRLRGRGPATDAMIVDLDRYAPAESPHWGGMPLLEHLEKILAAADG